MSAQALSLDTAVIVGTVLQGILYGFSLLLFGGTLWAMGYQRRQMNRSMAFAAVLFCILSTMNMVISFIRVEEAFVIYGCSHPGGPLAYFADIGSKSVPFKNVVYVLQTLLGDGVVIYRCYVVWQSRWIAMLLTLGWCVVAVTSIGSLLGVSQQVANVFSNFQETNIWFISFFMSSLVINLLASGLLAFRIWNTERKVAPARASKSMKMLLVRVVIEAAILYSVTLLALIATFVTSNNGQYIVIGLIVPIISITFYMSFIRIALAKERARSSDITRAGTISTLHHYPMDPRAVRVHVSKSTERYQDFV